MHEDQIRQIVGKTVGVPADAEALTASSDLYGAGLTSLTTVHLMLALEDHFQIEFPDRMLGRKTFGSIQSISEAVEELLA